MGKNFRLAFVIFHIVLGGVVFLLSVSTFLHSIDGRSAGGVSHLALLALIEAIAAVLFLIPKTARIGGALLLAVFAFAIYIHGIRGELSLLVYAAGVVLVMVEGGTYKT